MLLFSSWNEEKWEYIKAISVCNISFRQHNFVFKQNNYRTTVLPVTSSAKLTNQIIFPLNFDHHRWLTALKLVCCGAPCFSILCFPLQVARGHILIFLDFIQVL